jgi:hypothetical protein
MSITGHHRRSTVRAAIAAPLSPNGSCTRWLRCGSRAAGVHGQFVSDLQEGAFVDSTRPHIPYVRKKGC